MASNEGRGDICTAITSFISWLARLLASLFKRSRPLEELPIVMSGSQQTMALLEAFRAEDQGITVQIGANQSSHVPSAHPRPHVRRHHPTGPNLDPPIERRFIRSATAPMKTKSFSSMLVTRREKPLSNYPTAFRWTAPITRPEDDNWGSVRDTCPTDDDKVHSGIGNLGQRRGFKGKPLMVSKWSRSSTFLSLPKGLSFSPRSSSMNSLDGAFPSSPRTPLEAVANRMRSVSVSVASWSSGVKALVPEVSQNLQDLYDTSDPFASHGDTFFAFMTGVSAVPTPDLCQFGFYRQYRTARKQSCIAKKNTLLQVALHPAFTNARMKTTIYDMSTADVVPARVTVPAARNTVAASLGVSERGLDVVMSPTIVLTAPPSPTIYEVDNDETELAEEFPVSDGRHERPDNGQLISETPELGSKEENKTRRPVLVDIRNTVPPFEQNQRDISGLTTQPTPLLFVSPATDSLGDNSLTNVQLPTFQYAEFPKVVYETCASPCRDDGVPLPFPGVADTLTPCWPISIPQSRSLLRPLVLPARVASRLSARIAPVPEDDTGRSQALEGIIALLDVGLAAQEM